MAHFAVLNANNNVVLNIIRIDNNTQLEGLDFPESEPIGIEVCKRFYRTNENGASITRDNVEVTFKQTSYNTLHGKYMIPDHVLPHSTVAPPEMQSKAFRKNYAIVNGTYSPEYDAFIFPKPEGNPSFVLNMTTFDWEPPIPRPTEGIWRWNEATTSWIPDD